MRCLIKRVTVIDPASSLHRKTVDLFLEDGVLRAVNPDPLPPADRVIEEEGLMLSPGWMDAGAYTGDPGMEHREDQHSLREAAAAGGYTQVAVWPNTQPALESKSDILYIRNQNRGHVVALLPIGALSHDCSGEMLTEMIDMHTAGAIAFSDGLSPLQDGGLLLRALQYVQFFDGLVLNHPLDWQVAAGGQMHEGVMSTSLGLRGLPRLAEELTVHRDLEILAYTGSRLHLHGISSAGSVEKIRLAKKAGLKITASVPVMNLVFTDQELGQFDSNFKVLPPLREETDRQALIRGLKDGTIDFIYSNHVPLDPEAKELEFPYADFGAIGLETAFSLCRTYLKKELPLDELIEWLAIHPRRVLGLPAVKVEEGAAVDFTLFHPDREWVYEKKQFRSKSHNTPLAGKTLKGKALGVLRGNHAWFSK
ncbi:MAG: dihydroorotase [Saprospirales bacterium]|nr:dihydroorotase [Saprospirales bacterium]